LKSRKVRPANWQQAFYAQNFFLKIRRIAVTLNNKIAIITGSGSGIGRASALLFAAEGAAVVVADIQKEDAAETVQMIRQNGQEAISVQTDVSRSADAQAMVAQTIRQYGRLDILFNNAGIDIAKSIVETTEEEWDRTLAINLKGVFLGCKFSIPTMIDNGGGVIINTASILAHVASPNQAAYCASKGGIVALTRQIAYDYAQHNIRANCISPGDVMTPMAINFFESCENPEERLKFFTDRYPMKRFAEPDEIARVALFLASEGSSFITGQAVKVEGGFSIW
jgi:NAD(P)-dependent dehydrogenase (short-subunit alcohol dehydrogenase family)